MKNITTKKYDSKKISKMCTLFEELYSDKTPFITGEYVKKTETLLSLFFDLFIKAEFEGLPAVSPCFDSWDKTKEIDLTGEMWFGETTLDDKIVINTGVLFYASSIYEELEKELPTDEKSKQIYNSKKERLQKEFFEYRNELLSRLIDTVAHECRHGMQKMYLNFMQKPEKHKNEIALLASRLGKAVDAVKGASHELFADTSERDYSDAEMLSEFAYPIGLIDKKQYSDYQQQMMFSGTAYQINPAEKDARRYANIKMWELAKVLREYHTRVKASYEGGFIKTPDVRDKFYRLSNARAEFSYNTSEQIIEEMGIAQREKMVKTIEKQIAQKITPAHIIAMAKKYDANYLKHSTAQLSFLKFLNSLLRNKEICTFFENKQNLNAIISQLRDLNFPSCVNFLKNLSEPANKLTIDK